MHHFSSTLRIRLRKMANNNSVHPQKIPTNSSLIPKQMIPEVHNTFWFLEVNIPVDKRSSTRISMTSL